METRLYLIPTFHHDIAYLRPERWYTDRATAILDKALQLMEQDAHYTFTVEQAYFFREYWNAHPELHDRLRRMRARAAGSFRRAGRAADEIRKNAASLIFV